MFLGSYVAKMTGRKNMYIWAGECHVHAGIRSEEIHTLLDSYTNSELLVHPECSCTSQIMYDVAVGDYQGRQVQIMSTEGMMNYAKQSAGKNFVVATETGILYRMQQQNPEKTFIPASRSAVCQYMKMITLEKVHAALLDEKHEVRVSKPTADKARLAIERMLAIS
jgi:quinolinate synthase